MHKAKTLSRRKDVAFVIGILGVLVGTLYGLTKYQQHQVEKEMRELLTSAQAHIGEWKGYESGAQWLLSNGFSVPHQQTQMGLSPAEQRQQFATTFEGTPQGDRRRIVLRGRILIFGVWSELLIYCDDDGVPVGTDFALRCPRPASDWTPEKR